jgi:hypothetical protein
MHKTYLDFGFQEVTYCWGYKIVFIFIMQDIFIKSVVRGFSPANRCSPKGLRYIL